MTLHLTEGSVQYGRVLERVAESVQGVLGEGRVADHIPALADADPYAFGMALATVDGELHGVGDGGAGFRFRASRRCSRSLW